MPTKDLADNGATNPRPLGQIGLGPSPLMKFTFQPENKGRFHQTHHKVRVVSCENHLVSTLTLRGVLCMMFLARNLMLTKGYGANQ